MVKDGINDGSYNYFARVKEPLKHFYFDISPWILWGNSRKDTTSKKERIYAFVCDLEIGIRAALKQKDQLNSIQKVNWDNEGQIQALALFIFAQEKCHSKSLIELFEKDLSTLKDQDVVEVLKCIEAGLNKIY